MVETMVRRPFGPGGALSQSHRDITAEKYRDLRRPRRVRFYANGDRYFQGKLLFITPHRYLNFSDLLNDLTNKLPNNVHLPYGVRQIFTPIGGHRIHVIEDLQDGQAYVCAGFETYKEIQYGKESQEPWTVGKPHSHDFFLSNSTDNAGYGQRFHNAFHPGRMLRHSYPYRVRPQPGTFGSRGGYNSYLGSMQAASGYVDPASIKPKVITIVRHSSEGPRANVKILLNRRSVQSYEQLMKDIAEAFGPKWKNSRVRKLYTIKGREVNGVSDFFRDEDVFIGVGNEALNLVDVQDILEELYPDSPYAKNYLKEWERPKKRSKGRGKDSYDDPSKKDSGLGSDTSNRDEQDRFYMDKKPADRYILAADEDAAWRIEQERQRAADEERERARRRMKKKLDAEKRALEEERRKRGLVPFRPSQDPFKKMQEEKEKERKRRLAEERARQAELEKEMNRSRNPEREEPRVIVVMKGGDESSTHKSPSRKKYDYDSDNENHSPNRTGAKSKRKNRKKIEPDSTSDDDGRSGYPDASSEGTKSRQKGKHNKSPIKDNKSKEKDEGKEQSSGETPNRRRRKPPLNTDPDEEEDSQKKKSVSKPEKKAKTKDDADKAIPDDQGKVSSPEKRPRKESTNETNKKKKDKGNVIRKTKLERQISNLQTVMDKYIPGKVLGDGNFAVVKQCTLRGTSNEYAMKIIDKSKLKGKENMVENEIEVMKLCNHPNIVKLIEEYETKDEIYLIMELVKIIELSGW